MSLERTLPGLIGRSRSIGRALSGRREEARRALDRLDRLPIGSRSGRGPSADARVILVGAAIAGTFLGFILGRTDRRRRKLMQDQALSITRTAAGAAGRVARDLRNRALGYLAVSARLFERGEVIDEVLEARVRSALGREVRHLRAIEIAARDGHVTLSGPIPGADHQAALDCVRGVRGVSEVEDRLSVHERAGDAPALEGDADPPARATADGPEVEDRLRRSARAPSP
jgi:osmotically-inducible protein OsmY